MKKFLYILIVGLMFALVSPMSIFANVANDSTLHQETILAIQATIEQNFIATPEGASINNIQITRPQNNQNFEFTIILLLFAIPAIFRYVNPAYFNNIFVAYRNPNLSARQLKDQLSQNSLASLVMDFYFCFVFGAYAFFLIKYKFYNFYLSFDNELLLIVFCTLFFACIYAFKYAFLIMMGWVMKQQDVFNNYSFNVFLINKVLAITLIPFLLIIAFGEGSWVQASTFVSFIVVLLAFAQRYIRSSALFGNLLKYSKFHFFLYLCASEIVPFAILGKALSNYL